MPLLLKPVFTRLFLFMYILGIMSSILTVDPYPTAKMYANAPWELLIDVYLLSAIICLVPKNIRIWKTKAMLPLRLILRAVVYAFMYPLYIIDMFCFVKFGSTLNPAMILLMGETNGNEASEFFGSYVTSDVIFSEVGLLLLVPLVHILVAVLWHKYGKKCCKPTQKKLPLWSRAVVNIAVLAGLIWLVDNAYDNKMLFHKVMASENIGQVEHVLSYRPHTEMYQPPMRLMYSIYSNELVAQQVGILEETLNKANIDSCDFKSPNIVLIIGESFNKRHAQIYGYDKPNMPNQMALQKAGRLTAMQDAVSPWNLTSFFFKHLMTTYCMGDTADWCNYPLFCQLFRNAGYKVTFITNQFLPQAKEAVYDFSGGFFLNNEKLSAAQFDYRNSELHIFDEELLRDYDKIQDAMPEKEKQEAKTHGNLTIFHLMGMHVNYRIRCPNSKKKWTKDDYKNEVDLDDKRRKVMSNYDNAVWYNDSVVNNIVNKFKDEETIIIYLSDHGEEVFDKGARHFFGRMHNAAITKRLADEEFRVPMWIYCSRKYIQKHRDVYAAIKGAKNKRYMTDALSHMLLGLAGIHTPYYNAQYDLLSPQYNEKRKRILKHTVDYDTLK